MAKDALTQDDIRTVIDAATRATRTRLRVEEGELEDAAERVLCAAVESGKIDDCSLSQPKLRQAARLLIVWTWRLDCSTVARLDAESTERLGADCKHALGVEAVHLSRQVAKPEWATCRLDWFKKLSRVGIAHHNGCRNFFPEEPVRLYGRERDLLALVHATGKNPVTWLVGLPGTGKTTLVTRLSETLPAFKSYYFAAAAGFCAWGPDRIREALSEQVGLPLDEGTEPLSWLRAHAASIREAADFLIVVDNAESLQRSSDMTMLDAVLSVVRELFPFRIVVVTRDCSPRLLSREDGLVNLGPIDRDAAREMLATAWEGSEEVDGALDRWEALPAILVALALLPAPQRRRWARREVVVEQLVSLGTTSNREYRYDFGDFFSSLDPRHRRAFCALSVFAVPVHRAWILDLIEEEVLNEVQRGQPESRTGSEADSVTRGTADEILEELAIASWLEVYPGGRIRCRGAYRDYALWFVEQERDRWRLLHSRAADCLGSALKEDTSWHTLDLHVARIDLLLEAGRAAEARLTIGPIQKRFLSAEGRWATVLSLRDRVDKLLPKNSIDRIRNSVSMAVPFVRLDQPKEAEGRLIEAIADLEERGDLVTLEIGYNNLGIALGVRRQSAESLRCYQESEKLARTLLASGKKSPELVGVRCANIAERLSELGRPGEAEAYLAEALEIASQHQLRKLEGQVRSELGIMGAYRGEESAMLELDHALRIALDNDVRDKARAVVRGNWLATAYLLLRNDARVGLALANQNVADARTLASGRYRADALSCLGELQHSTGDPYAAVSSYREAIDAIADRIPERTVCPQALLALALTCTSARHEAAEPARLAIDMASRLLTSSSGLTHERYFAALARLCNGEIDETQFRQCLYDFAAKGLVWWQKRGLLHLRLYGAARC